MPHLKTSTTCVALLIAAPASGQGKTTVTAALARMHTRQGRRVRVFKCGPDYLDPFWHELASESPVQNLDGWMMGIEQLQNSLYWAAKEADLILIEGVMGLFDGTPTAADLAQQLGIHVLGVIDAQAMAGTFGALVLGMQCYQPGVQWAGVLANRVASERHAQMLQRSLKKTEQWLGAVSHLGESKKEALLPERHLGLVAAYELPDAVLRLDKAADALAATPLGAMTWNEWQRWETSFHAVNEPIAEQCHALMGKKIAVAKDAAFSFIYPANIACLEQLGAEVVLFSPLQGDRLPMCDAVWLPGGYPELHVQDLAANTALRDDLFEHVKAKKPIWAECGGMLALSEGFAAGQDEKMQGQYAHLWGVIPGKAQMQSNLAGLGMHQCAVQGGWLRGHTFHYSVFETSASTVTRTCRPHQSDTKGSLGGEAIYQFGSVYATYFHAWFPSNPQAIAAIFGAEPVRWGDAGAQ